MTVGLDIDDVFDLLDDCVIARDMDGRITAWNRAAEGVYGIMRDRAIGMRLASVFPSEENLADHLAESRRLIKRGVSSEVGSIAVSVASKPILDVLGNQIGVFEVSRPMPRPETLEPPGDLDRILVAAGLAVFSVDATDAFRTIEALGGTVANIRDYLRQDLDLVSRLMQSATIDARPLIEGSGSPIFPTKLRGRALAAFWPEEGMDAFIDAIASVLVDEKPALASCKLMRENGETFEAELVMLRASAVPGQARLLLAIRDVSKAIEAYKVLEASELRYKNLFEYMPIALTQVDASGLVEMFAQLRRQGVEDLSTYIDEHPEFLDLAMEVMLVEQVNQSNVDLFGAESAENMRGPITHYFRDTGRDTLRKSLEARYQGQDFFQQEARLRRLDDSVVDVLYAASRHSSLPDKSLVAFMDISDRKRAEEALKRSERRYQDLFQAMTVSFWEFDLSAVHNAFPATELGADTDIQEFLRGKPECVSQILSSMRIVDVNEQTVALFGGALKDYLLKTLDCFWAPDRRADGASAVLSVLKTGESVTIETKLLRSTGDEFDAQFTLWFSTGDRRRGLAAVTDISERVKAFNDLEQSEQRFKDLFDHLPIPVMQVNSTGLLKQLAKLKAAGVDDLRSYMHENTGFLWAAMEGTVIEQANNAAAKIMGASDPGTLRGPITPLWRNHPDVYERLLQNRYFELSAFEEEVTLTTFDGQTREGILTVTFPPALAKHGITINAFVDTTDKNNAERRLRHMEAEHAHAARISMLGELTASIAHEVNQPLAAITTYGEAGLRWLNRPDPELSEVRDIVTRIVGDAQRAASIIARVRKMASQRKQEEEVVSLNEIVAEALQFLSHEFRSHAVKVLYQPQSQALPIRGDRIQLQQVVVNLVFNATQAISAADSAVREVRITTAEVEGDIQCCVEDSGPGLSQEVLSRMFQSFFTTKEGGMGMGLPISRSIIEAHGGRMLADNGSSSGGARFTFVLPKVQ